MYNPDEECKAMIATLKTLCEQKNMTPHALAKEAGISTSTISYLMNGRTKPQVYTILMLCNVLGVTISELFEGRTTRMYTKCSEFRSRYITCEEDTLLDCYRLLSSKKKELLQIYVDMLLRYEDTLLVGINDE